MTRKIKPVSQEVIHMLLLSVSEGDYIMIGDNIKVHFDHKVNQNTLDLAVEAPKEITVLRGKLYEENAGSGANASSYTG
jgi:carbon storage regulator CsrA